MLRGWLGVGHSRARRRRSNFRPRSRSSPRCCGDGESSPANGAPRVVEDHRDAVVGEVQLPLNIRPAGSGGSSHQHSATQRGGSPTRAISGQPVRGCAKPGRVVHYAASVAAGRPPRPLAFSTDDKRRWGHHTREQEETLPTAPSREPGGHYV